MYREASRAIIQQDHAYTERIQAWALCECMHCAGRWRRLPSAHPASTGVSPLVLWVAFILQCHASEGANAVLAISISCWLPLPCEPLRNPVDRKECMCLCLHALLERCEANRIPRVCVDVVASGRLIDLTVCITHTIANADNSRSYHKDPLTGSTQAGSSTTSCLDGTYNCAVSPLSQVSKLFATARSTHAHLEGPHQP